MRGRLETLRGGACLLLVLYHVIGMDGSSGLRIGEGWLRIASDWLALVRMPLFAFLAGWFYAERPVLAGQAGAFIQGKAERLLLPLVTVGTLYLIAQAVAPGVNHRATAIPFLMPVAHLWFIQALFIIFVVVAAAERGGLLRDLNRWYVAMAVAATVYLSGVTTPWLAIGGVLYLLPYVLLGIGLRRFGDMRRLQDPACMIVLMSAAWALAAASSADFNEERRTAAYLALATCLVLLALASRWRSELLIRVGGSSYAIFLFHAFFTAGSRIVLERAGVSSLAILVPAGMLSGVLGPLLVHRYFKNKTVAAALFLGTGWPRAVDTRTAERFRPAVLPAGTETVQATAASGISNSLASRRT